MSRSVSTIQLWHSMKVLADQKSWALSRKCKFLRRSVANKAVHHITVMLRSLLIIITRKKATTNLKLEVLGPSMNKASKTTTKTWWSIAVATSQWTHQISTAKTKTANKMKMIVFRFWPRTEAKIVKKSLVRLRWYLSNIELQVKTMMRKQLWLLSTMTILRIAWHHQARWASLATISRMSHNLSHRWMRVSQTVAFKFKLVKSEDRLSSLTSNLKNRNNIKAQAAPFHQRLYSFNSRSH